MTARCRTLSRLAVPTAVTCATVLLPATAWAAEPERSGWWNRASAGSVAAPQPTAREGDLRIGALGPDEPTAYAAVLFSAPGSSTATLDVELRSTTGTPELAACPTADTAWEEGGNQPYSKAPAYDCAAGTAFGSLAEDGKTLTFDLDTTTQTEPGVWSLALVPLPGSRSGPFTVDLVAPGPDAFQAAPPESSTTAPGTSGSDTTSPESTSASGGGSGEAFLPGNFTAPPSDTGSAELPPLVAGGAAPEPAGAAPPAVAAGAPPVAAPVLLARPAGLAEDVGSGRRLLGLLVLAGGSAAVGYAAGQQRPGPRLIGGRSRLVVPAAAPAVVGGAPAQDRPRGIGRFAKTRDAAPRRLR